MASHADSRRGRRVWIAPATEVWIASGKPGGIFWSAATAAPLGRLTSFAANPLPGRLSLNIVLRRRPSSRRAVVEGRPFGQDDRRDPNAESGGDQLVYASITMGFSTMVLNVRRNSAPMAPSMAR